MFYPEEFKARVKKAYPKWKDLHQRLDNGDTYVGNYLKDSTKVVSLDTILNATSLKKLQDTARDAQEKVKLYCEWKKLYDEQYSI